MKEYLSENIYEKSKEVFYQFITFFLVLSSSFPSSLLHSTLTMILFILTINLFISETILEI